VLDTGDGIWTRVAITVWTVIRIRVQDNGLRWRREVAAR
jgi:hypothetical protein